MLSDTQIERYSRQILIPEFGGAGQERLLAGCVVVRGATVAAETAATYLAAAGVGQLMVAAALVPNLYDLNPDTTLTSLPEVADDAAWHMLPQRCRVVVWTGVRPVELAALHAWVQLGGRLVVWGDDDGSYALLAAAGQVAASWCSAVGEEPADHSATNDILGFLAGTQLASIAMAGLLDWPLPELGTILYSGDRIGR